MALAPILYFFWASGLCAVCSTNAMTGAFAAALNLFPCFTLSIGTQTAPPIGVQKGPPFRYA